MGSGYLIDLQKKLVLTNYHVVDEEETVFVQFPMFVKDKMITDKKVYMDNIPAGLAIKGKVIFRDKTRDLALVELASVPKGTPALPLARKSPEPGDEVWNVCSLGDVNQVFSITRGEVRAVAIEKFMVTGSDPGDNFRMRCKMVTATNPVGADDGGGPLVNKKGELVAVTEASRTRASLVNFFVDVTEVRAFLKEKKVKFKEPWLDPDSLPIDKNDLVRPKNDDPRSLQVPAKKVGVAAPVVNDKTEKEAAVLLQRAKLFADDPDQRDYYWTRLKEVIKKYPGTEAAKEAQKRLDRPK